MNKFVFRKIKNKTRRRRRNKKRMATNKSVTENISSISSVDEVNERHREVKTERKMEN